jgi:glutamate receptor, ionotropic, invertebrate
MWWFFALIMLASYTANLAAFLTADRMNLPIKSAEDLSKQSEIKYGAMMGGSTISFFSNNNYTTYQKMWSAMEMNGEKYTPDSNDAGVKLVKEEKGLYAFMMESSAIEYQRQKHCSLVTVGDLLDSKGYGIAMPMGGYLMRDGVLTKYA